MSNPTALEAPAAPAAAGFMQKPAVNLLLRYSMVLVLGALIVVTSIAHPNFWSTDNLQNLLQQNVGLLLCSIGMTFVILAGGFDLSVGSVYAAGAMLYISFNNELTVVLAVILAVLLGIVLGIMNGALINVLRVNPFVVTLGTATIIIGGITLYAGANIEFSASSSYLYLGTEKFGSIPLSVVIGAIIFAIAAVVLAKTSYGRSVYAIGGNREAARLAGIRVGMVSASTFVIIGALAALGGVFTASQLGTAQPNFVGNITLESIAVVIIGGTALTGGEGAMWRTGVGLAIIAVIRNLFTSLNFDPNLQLVLQGVIVIFAVALDVLANRRR